MNRKWFEIMGGAAGRGRAAPPEGPLLCLNRGGRSPAEVQAPPTWLCARSHTVLQLPTVLWLRGGNWVPDPASGKNSHLHGPACQSTSHSSRTPRPWPSSPFQIPCEGLNIDPTAGSCMRQGLGEVQSLKSLSPGRQETGGGGLGLLLGLVWIVLCLEGTLNRSWHSPRRAE